jgi:hypothetical protein
LAPARSQLTRQRAREFVYLYRPPAIRPSFHVIRRFTAVPGPRAVYPVLGRRQLRMQMNQWKVNPTLRFALLAIAAVGVARAADKPNLSGNWKMDLANSDFGGGPAPDSLTRKIEHSEPSLIFTDEQTSALGTEKAIRKYTTDAKETTYEWMGGEVKSAAHWEQNTLMIVGKVDASGTDVTVNSTITISADGKTLTESDKILAAGNEIGAFKIVFVKQ